MDLRVKAVAVYAALSRAEGWVSAVRLTEDIRALARESLGVEWPWSYRPTAFALRLLVRCDLAEERIVTYRGAHRTREYRREYRLLRLPQQDSGNPFIPIALPSPAGTRRVIRAGG